MVEIFFNQELEDIVFDVESQETWKQLSEELGLTKQLAFVKGKESPLPYPFMNESMQRIYGTLCAKKQNFKEYDKTPIPTQVLEQIALSIRDKYFQEIQIWSDEKQPDPLVVGITYKWYNFRQNENKQYYKFDTEKECKEFPNSEGKTGNAYKTDINHYLVARWGDVLRPLKELKELAKERLIDKYGSELQNELKDIQHGLEKIKENANLYLLAEISENQLKGKRW
jgi:hypothetical protein